jgi:hypothetical protein
MNFDTFKAFTTGNKAIDWVLTRAHYTDDSDKYGYTYTAFFSGKLPDRMINEFRAMAKANGGSMYRIDTGEGGYTINVHFSQGEYKGNWNQVKVYATCTENC